MQIIEIEETDDGLREKIINKRTKKNGKYGQEKFENFAKITHRPL